mgnify:CR=1 FL=1
MVYLILIILLYIKITATEIPNNLFSVMIAFVLICYVLYGNKPHENFLSDDNDKEHFLDDSEFEALEINKHWRMIEAVKEDDVHVIQKYYKESPEKVTLPLKTGYEGNTIFHHIAYHGTPKCIMYFLEMIKKFPRILTVENVDKNTVIHIIALRGNYNALYHILKIISSDALKDLKNIHDDNILHCAVRSGSYNCVKIILDKQENHVMMDETNIWDEKPRNTAINPVRDVTELDEVNEGRDKDRMNLDIVKILIEKNENIRDNLSLYNNKNRDNDDILMKELMKKPLSIVREQIRTYLEKMYYDQFYKDKSSAGWNSIIAEVPEICPYEKDTSVNHEQIILEYPNKYIDNEELYTEKETEGTKVIP